MELRPRPPGADRPARQRVQLPHARHLRRPGKGRRKAPGLVGLHPVLRRQGGPRHSRPGHGGERIRTLRTPQSPDRRRVSRVCPQSAARLGGGLPGGAGQRGSRALWAKLPAGLYLRVEDHRPDPDRQYRSANDPRRRRIGGQGPHQGDPRRRRPTQQPQDVEYLYPGGDPVPEPGGVGRGHRDRRHLLLRFQEGVQDLLRIPTADHDLRRQEQDRQLAIRPVLAGLPHHAPRPLPRRDLGVLPPGARQHHGLPGLQRARLQRVDRDGELRQRDLRPGVLVFHVDLAQVLPALHDARLRRPHRSRLSPHRGTHGKGDLPHDLLPARRAFRGHRHLPVEGVLRRARPHVPAHQRGSERDQPPARNPARPHLGRLAGAASMGPVLQLAAHRLGGHGPRLPHLPRRAEDRARRPL